jgi:ribosome-binding protein aMBF1 (putative translation factor)
MNTSSSIAQSNKKRWETLLSFENESEEIKHEAQMLMYSFLSEVEKFQELESINRKTLSEKIKTSASYLTQLFRGNKPLNFETIAKIKRVLDIGFIITAYSKKRPNTDIKGSYVTNRIEIDAKKYSHTIFPFPFSESNDPLIKPITIKGDYINFIDIDKQG